MSLDIHLVLKDGEDFKTIGGERLFRTREELWAHMGRGVQGTLGDRQQSSVAATYTP